MATNTPQIPAYVQVLSAEDKRLGQVQKSANGLLAAALRKVFYDLGYSPSAWDQTIDDYLTSQKGEQNRFDRANTRSALNSELFEDSITFKVLIKALKVLQMDKVEIEIRGIKYRQGVQSMVSAVLNPDVLKEIIDNEPLFRENKKPTVRKLEDNRSFDKPLPEAETNATGETTNEAKARPAVSLKAEHSKGTKRKKGKSA